MTLALGTKLGPYEIVSPLGAGGMGEVYRARDGRLDRDVAVKVLPASFSRDADRLHRFEQEARATAALNHPNILAIFDIGVHDQSPYVVSELLEGETLRQRLTQGSLSVRKAIDYALQISRGLAAAHEKGIVHRDLKPENIFITKDSRVKVLDFGLAKLTSPQESKSDFPTLTLQTEPGVVLGTMGYMSPEQARGRAADPRSDLFSLGTILYEMVSGKRAFHGETPADTISAILTKEPPDLSETNRSVPPGLERIVRHCIEKEPQARFQSAHDLSFDLEALSGFSGSTAAASAAVKPVAHGWRFRALLTAILVLGALAAGFLFGRRRMPGAPAFHQLTFRRGTILSARFAPDGQTVIYGASWEGRPMELFSTRADGVDSRDLDLHNAEILAISASGEMALLLDRQFGVGWDSTGKLARVSLSGGAPREMMDGAQNADWSPTGSNLAVVRQAGSKYRLEYPPGKVLYESNAWISHARVAPKAEGIAFIDHPYMGDDGGSIMFVDLSGNTRKLTGYFESAWGLAWSPSGKEIWFTAAVIGANRILQAVTLSGKHRVLLSGAGALNLEDVAHDGRVLMIHNTARRVAIGLAPGESHERDLSWLDWTNPSDISPDGKWFVFSEQAAGGGGGYSVYIRKTDGSPAIRLGEGRSWGLSPDGRWVLSSPLRKPAQLVALPIGVGEPKQLTSDSVDHEFGYWFPDGHRIAFIGSEPGRGVRTYVQDLAGGPPRAVTPEGVYAFLISPDGQLLLCGDSANSFSIYPVESGSPRPLSATFSRDVPVSWSNDGKSVYVLTRREVPAHLYRIDLATQRRERVRDFAPSDPSGMVTGVSSAILAAHANAYVYGYPRLLSDLYIVDGLN